jgi:hypothetical protein
MSYIVVLVFILIVTPLLVILLSRKTHRGPRDLGKSERGVTLSEPSSDQPSAAGGAVNKLPSGAEGRLPPA